MGSNEKNAVRARRQKTGQSHEAALRDVRAARRAALEPPARLPGGRSVEQLLAELHTPNTFAVLAGRTPATASGPNLALVRRRVDELARNPQYYADSGSVDMTVSLDEHNRLIAAGAMDDRKGQIIRSHRFAEGEPFHGWTFSVTCEACNRWIWCGTEPRESACVCGNPYRVVFNLSAELALARNLERDPRCADCGAVFEMHLKEAGHSPWRRLNEGQVQCNACFGADSMLRATLRAVGPETAGADDFDIGLTSWTLEQLRDGGGVSELRTADVRVATVPPSGYALRRYNAITVGGDAMGPVTIETPAGEGPVRVKVGDRIRIRVSNRGA